MDVCNGARQSACERPPGSASSSTTSQMIRCTPCGIYSDDQGRGEPLGVRWIDIDLDGLERIGSLGLRLAVFRSAANDRQLRWQDDAEPFLGIAVGHGPLLQLIHYHGSQARQRKSRTP
jgi:hypothetical protein